MARPRKTPLPPQSSPGSVIKRDYAPHKYSDLHPKLAYSYSILGATVIQMAAFFEVNKDTITQWQHDHPEFKAAILAGREQFDAEIAAKVGQRIKGMKVTTRTKKYHTIDEDGQPVEITETVNELPPDAGAGLKWLAARQPQWNPAKNVNVSVDVFSSILDELDDEDEGEIIDAEFEDD